MSQHEGDMYSDYERRYAMEQKSITRKELKKRDLAATNFAVRGKGKTGITHRVITDAERMTVCMLRGKGLSSIEIGEKLKRLPNVIDKILRDAEAMSRAAGLNYDWREDLREKSVAALRAGLTHGDDPYKAAGLGVQTLKGLGEFERDGQVNIAALINSVPENMKTRYITLESPDPNLLSSEATSETIDVDVRQEFDEAGSVRSAEGSVGDEAKIQADA